MKLFCIGHKPPVFTPGLPYVHVSPTAYPGYQQLLVPDDAYGSEFHGSVLSEYTQLFGLADHLARTPQDQDGRLFIFQYRKFLSLRPGAQRSINILHAYACPQAEAEALFPSRAELLSLDQQVLIGPMGTIRSMAANYARFHVTEDFAAFTISLSRLPEFPEARCLNFINCKHLFPAPSLGVVPVGLFLRHMHTLRTVWAHFGKHFLQGRSAYQRRVGGFLLERLHSFLIYEELVIQKRLPLQQGSQIVVSDSPRITASA